MSSKINKLKNKIYITQYDTTNEQYYFKELKDKFELPDKIYGKELDIVNRYIHTFDNRNGNMGILLSGQKGGGKTLTAKIISNTLKIPTILITIPVNGKELHKLILGITQNVMIFIDEFEKIYDTQEKQEDFLSILDGVFDGKKLFVFTSNTSDINRFFKSRPGRIRYHREYYGLDEDTIDEIIDDKLLDKNDDNIQELKSIINLLGSVSADVLLTIIDEMNLYNESARESVKYLNVQVEHNLFDVTMFISGKRHFSTARFNPLTTNRFYLEYIDTEGRERYIFAKKDDMNTKIYDNRYVFEDKINNTKFIFTPIKSKKFNFYE